MKISKYDSSVEQMFLIFCKKIPTLTNLEISIRFYRSKLRFYIKNQNAYTIDTVFIDMNFFFVQYHIFYFKLEKLYLI